MNHPLPGKMKSLPLPGKVSHPLPGAKPARKRASAKKRAPARKARKARKAKK